MQQCFVMSGWYTEENTAKVTLKYSLVKASGYLFIRPWFLSKPLRLTRTQIHPFIHYWLPSENCECSPMESDRAPAFIVSLPQSQHQYFNGRTKPTQATYYDGNQFFISPSRTERHLPLSLVWCLCAQGPVCTSVHQDEYPWEGPSFLKPNNLNEPCKLFVFLTSSTFFQVLRFRVASGTLINIKGILDYWLRSQYRYVWQTNKLYILRWVVSFTAAMQRYSLGINVLVSISFVFA